MRSRTFSYLRTAWCWWSYLCGAAAISLGIAYIIVTTIAGDKPVVEEADNIRIESTRVRVGGQIEVTMDMKRNEACPGDVVLIYKLLGVESPSVVTVRRSVQENAVREFKGAHYSIPIPAGVGPGKWRFELGVDSRCPTRQRYDPLMTANIEVIP
jgi:hypothetical protein